MKANKREKTTELLRVAAYIRVSTEDERQADSYENQRIHFEALLEENPYWLSAGIYSDYGVSGTSKERRIGFNRLLRHCQEGKIDRIVTKSISRFSRNTRDFLKALEILKENHITIHFEKEHIDTSLMQNDMMLTAFGAIAQEESYSISENIRWGIEKRYKRGDVRNFPIYGYRYSDGEWETTEYGYSFRKIVIYEDEAQVVRRIFKEAAQGRKLVSIAGALNREHIPVPQTFVLQKRKEGSEAPIGKLHPDLESWWTSKQIGQMLTLERYAGDVLLHKTYRTDYKTQKVLVNKGEKTQYYVKNHHPAIISRELFQEVQQIREKKEELKDGKKCQVRYSFSGKLVCAHCGRFFWTKNRKSRPIWYCPSTLAKTDRCVCKAQPVYEEQIFRMIQKAVNNRFHAFHERKNNGVSQIRSPFGTQIWVADSIVSESRGLVGELLNRLEMVHNADTIEKDSTLLNMKIAQAENKEDRERLKLQFQKLEQYGAMLEADYECRKKMIAWIRTLITENVNMTEFLNGLTGDYARALILFVKIESPMHGSVCWFDGTWTEVEMFSNVEEDGGQRR